jgi:hypothetical protein
MQSKNKPAQTVDEAAHARRISEMACGLCGASGPSEVHEIKQGVWFLSIPLCPDCHRGQHGGLHGDKAFWKSMKKDELDVLAETIRRLMK